MKRVKVIKYMVMVRDQVYILLLTNVILINLTKNKKVEKKDLNKVHNSPMVSIWLCLVLETLQGLQQKPWRNISFVVQTVSGPGMRILLPLLYRWSKLVWNESNNLLKITYIMNGKVGIQTQVYIFIITVVVMMMMSPNIFPGSTRIQQKSRIQNQNT